MKSIPFVVRVPFVTAPAFSQRIHLDGVLKAALFARTGDPALVEATFPLASAALPAGGGRTVEVALGSAAFLETLGERAGFGMATRPVVRVKSLQVAHMELHDLDVQPDMPNDLRRWRGVMSRYRGQLRPYETREGVAAAVFTGVGDPDAVASLLGDLPGLGSMVQTGHGEIAAEGIEVQELPDADPVACGLMLPSGHPVRSLPLAAWRYLGDLPDDARLPAGAKPETGRVAPPYWEPTDRFEVVAPTLAWLAAPAGVLRERLGLFDPDEDAVSDTGASVDWAALAAL